MDLLRRAYEPTAVADEVRSRANVARAVIGARGRLGLTQVELAERAETKQSRVSEIESFKGNPTLDTLARIARALNLMIDLVPQRAVEPGSENWQFVGVASPTGGAWRKESEGETYASEKPFVLTAENSYGAKVA